MAKKKRKAREEVIKKVDLFKPLDLDKIGTSEDPCFGKLFDPKEEECKICGDCEICSIIMGQKLHLQRAELEKETRFKDLEEVDLLKDPTTIIYNRLKRAENKFVSIENLKKELNRKGIPKKKIQRMEIDGYFKRLLTDENLKASKDNLKIKII
jgi:hypothetical protein